MIELPPRVPRKPKETDLVRSILAAINRLPGVRATRNNVGTIEDRRGVPVTFGLGEGSPDIVGILTFGGGNTAPAERDEGTLLLRTLDPLAVAFAIEVKQPKRYETRLQKAWHATARRRGLVSCVARSDEDAIAFLAVLRSNTILRIRQVSEALSFQTTIEALAEAGA